MTNEVMSCINIKGTRGKVAMEKMAVYRVVIGELFLLFNRYKLTSTCSISPMKYITMS